MLTGKQSIMARTLLGWMQKDIALAVGVSMATIQRFEQARSTPKESILNKIFQSYSDAGLEFLEGEGVRFRQDTITIYKDKDFYLKLLDNVYHTLKERNGELLYMFVDNSLSTPEVIQSEARIRKIANMRAMVRQGDTHLLYPLEEYRYIPGKFYLNYNVMIFGDKVANVLNDNTSAMVIYDRNYAEIMRNIFNQLWQFYDKPKKTTAPQLFE